MLTTITILIIIILILKLQMFLEYVRFSAGMGQGLNGELFERASNYGSVRSYYGVRVRGENGITLQSCESLCDHRFRDRNNDASDHGKKTNCEIAGIFASTQSYIQRQISQTRATKLTAEISTPTVWRGSTNWSRGFCRYRALCPLHLGTFRARPIVGRADRCRWWVYGARPSQTCCTCLRLYSTGTLWARGKSFCRTATATPVSAASRGPRWAASHLCNSHRCSIGNREWEKKIKITRGV